MGVVREFLSTVYVVDKGRVLLTWNKKVKTWIPVGGHIEQNELPCDSVIRGAKEESGLDIELVCLDDSPTKNLVQPVHVHLDHIKDDHKHINLIYFGRVIGSQFMEESDEQTRNRWFTKQEIEKEELMENVKEWALKAIERVENEKTD